MNRVLVLVEGDTELSFVDDILCPEFAKKGIFLSSSLFRKKHKGSFSYQNCQKRIVNYMKEDSSIYVTTFVDYYKLPQDWPGRVESQTHKDYQGKAQLIEQALLNDIINQLGDSWNPSQFIPYVQMHEFEALLFSDVSVLSEDNPKISDSFNKILESFSCPEEINDNYDTCPSRRIKRHLGDYDKRINGIIAAQRIGLRKMREECPHFNEWIEKLERIGK